MKKTISCPKCDSIKISKNGKTKKGEQRYICKELNCDGKSFKLEYIYNGSKPYIHKEILNIRKDDSGIRHIAKELGISKQKVQDTLTYFKHQATCACKNCYDK